jgi:menaquinone-dependent protoporphyrinogen oxidase
MADPRALVIYGTTHGQTAKIAGRIADTLIDCGVRVTLHAAGDGRDPRPDDFDGVIVAASVHRAAHQPAIVDYARRHRDVLNAHPSALVSVSLTAADDTHQARAATAEMIDKLISKTDWIPAATLGAAGALQFYDYDFMTRLLMRLTARQHGMTDTSHDHEFTDWGAVEGFAREFAATLGAPRGVRA